MNKAARTLTLVLHALMGWAWCGAIIGVGRKLTSMETVLIMHAIGAPLGFFLLSFFYFQRFGFTTPLVTALVFLSVVFAMDIFVVAPFIERSYFMFNSFIGTWLPFLLIFGSTYVTGCSVRRRQKTYKRPTQRMARLK